VRNLCSYCCSASLAEIKSLLGDKAGFLLRKKFGVGLNNAELIGDRFCSGPCVPRRRNGFDVHVAESLYRSSSARTRSVSDCFTHIAQSMCRDDNVSFWIIHIG
jgi:hypothetical protein